MAGPLDVLGRVHDLRANLGRQREFEKVDREETSGTHLEAGDCTLGQDARSPLVGRAVGDDGGLDVADRAVGGGRRAAPQAEVARVVGDERLALRVGPARRRVADVVAGLCVEGEDGESRGGGGVEREDAQQVSFGSSRRRAALERGERT